MVKFRRWIPGVLVLMMAASTCWGEDAEPAKFYKLEFVVKEVEGTRIVNSRAYSLVAATKGRAEIRAGSKVPYVSSSMPAEKGSPSAAQYQQIDVGVSIDVVGIKEVQDRLSFDMTAEVSSIAETPSASVNPVIRQNRWRSYVLIPLKKQTVLVSSDNVDARSNMQIEVTATPIP